jgi:hypothetical protein
LGWLTAAGFCLGMATGIRLSLAPLVLPILVIVVIHSRGNNRVVHNLAMLAVGGLVANLPALYFMIFHFDDFWFGNMLYPELNTAYFEAKDYQRGMDFPSKMNFIDNKILSKVNVKLMLAVTAAGLVMVGAQFLINKTRLRQNLLLVASCLLLLFLGCLTATPARKQYFFVLYPFLALFALQVISGLESKPWIQLATAMMVVVPLISLLSYSPYTSRARLAANLLGHHPTALHKLKQDVDVIQDLTPGAHENSTVLTLSPIFAISAGLSIDPRFTTGPFAFRVSGLLPESLARERGLPLEADTDDVVAVDNPVAIVTGREKIHDGPLIASALKHGYQPHTLPSGITLWLAAE